MSKDIYLGIFSLQMEATVFITLQIFFATCCFENWGIFSDIPQFWLGDIWSCAGLDQSCASEEI